MREMSCSHTYNELRAQHGSDGHVLRDCIVKHLTLIRKETKKGKICPRPCVNVLLGLSLLPEHHIQLPPASSRLQTSQTRSPGFSPEPSWCEDLGPSQCPHVSAAPNHQYTHGSGHLPKEGEGGQTQHLVNSATVQALRLKVQSPGRREPSVRF